MTVLMFRCFLPIVLAVVLFSGCGGNALDPANSQTGNSEHTAELSKITDDDYQIYSLVIEQLFVQGADTSLVIFSRTSTYHLPYADLDEAVSEISKRFADGISNDMGQDFLTKNSSSQVLEDRFFLSVPYHFMSSLENEELFKRDTGWTRSLAKYPRSWVIDLSRIGFNRQRDKAFIYISKNSGPKNGVGYYLVCVFENGRWAIKQKVEAWVR